MPSGSALRRALFSAPARRAWRIALLVLSLVVLALALVPSTDPLPSLGWDKADHAGAFAVLAVCGVYGMRGRRLALAKIALGLLALGIGIEWLQGQVPGRMSDWRDVVADALGIAAGLTLAHASAVKLDRRARPREGDAG